MEHVSEHIHMLFREARKDPEYASLTRDYTALEEQVGLLTEKLSEKERDLIWAFVCTSEAMNWRMIEWICEKYGIE